MRNRAINQRRLLLWLLVPAFIVVSMLLLYLGYYHLWFIPQRVSECQTEMSPQVSRQKECEFYLKMYR